MIRVTYLKQNGEIMQRTRNTLITYRIGETTSIGWKVLNIEYRYKNKYYSKVDYDEKIKSESKKNKIINITKRKFYNIYKELVYCITLLLFMGFFEKMLHLYI